MADIASPTIEQDAHDRRPTPRWVHSPIGRAFVPLRRWWLDNVVQDVDHTAVIAKIAGESSTSPRYIFMTMMSAGIAILGMLLSSPAVVIGAMLLSPLMSPILGAGFALASGKIKWLQISARALLIGTVAAIAFTALIVLLSPLQTMTPEIASRTRPNLFDLLVALFSSLAGSYAMIRGREGTIVGVAIATALMPPLAAVGYGLATMNWTVFAGAFALYVTNFLTIALTATIMARLYGFRTDLSKRQGVFQNVGIIAVFVALAIPLGLSLRQIALESNAQRLVQAAVSESFPQDAQVSDAAIDWGSEPLVISGTVFTPSFNARANTEISDRLRETLNRDVTVQIEQFRVGTDPGAAEQAQLAQARAEQQAEASEREIAALAANLALIAGVDRQAVTIDRDNNRAIVIAKPLPGLTLAGWRILERRAAAKTPNWDVELRPPLLPLPAIPLNDEGALTPDGQQAQQVIAWAADRLDLPVVLAGGNEEARDSVAEALAANGVTLTQTDGETEDVIEARWQTPEQ
ncbi:DUF389 domain-containing protein [Erythrobacter litoralis]|uniref:DUF389 domain-containing protein n=1 Tax=Erythrobacter litoralis TaxID=39960 RepID=UPI002434D597|nr:DUF389 domain-containing protein [Erythrobacter litoralis]MDG6080113.1 DUF389 domain-containing protein [Erythrobacter litoralis]